MLTSYISSSLALILLMALSILSFSQKNAVIFFITGGLAVITGLSWYNIYGTDLGLTISLILIVYSIVCVIAGIRCLFISRTPEKGEE